MNEPERRMLIHEFRKAILAECGWCRAGVQLLPELWRHQHPNGKQNMCLASNYLHERLKELQ